MHPVKSQNFIITEPATADVAYSKCIARKCQNDIGVIFIFSANTHCKTHDNSINVANNVLDNGRLVRSNQRPCCRTQAQIHTIYSRLKNDLHNHRTTSEPKMKWFPATPKAILKVSAEETFCHIFVHTQKWGLLTSVIAPYKISVENPESQCIAIFQVRRRPFSKSQGLYINCKQGSNANYKVLVEAIVASLRESMAVK